MADRSIRVILRAEVAQFRTEMNLAAKSASDTGAAAQSAGKQVQASTEQMERASKRVTDARRQELEATARLNTAEKRLDEVKRSNKATAAQVAAAEERALTSRGRLEKATENLASAEREHSKAMQVSAQNSQAATSKLRGLAQQAQANSEAWTAAGTALSVFGGAIVGVGVAAAKTGGEYNTLQQTSRAAMKTLMGGAEEANRQMDKLDAFAKSSPFAKQVFIQAQQQLIGFGVEAKKVIPYLGAIQDAVAATGGGNQQIKEIVETMSKIQSASKITGQDLIEFGNRGIDAAGLIGSQMGKTGAQIREDITAGTLGATEALDALTKGMQERFGGAAANVKEQMTGALDRVKSAWRDLSADLVEPFVSKNGGGMAVDWLNGIADKMREIEKMDPVVRNTGAALAGLGGAGALAAGGFLAMAPRIVETKDALKSLAAGGGLLGKASTAVGVLSKALVAATGVWVAFQAANWAANKVTKATIPDVEKINSELREMVKTGGDLTGAFNNSNALFDWVGGSKSIKDMGDALEIVSLRSEQGITGFVQFREAIAPGRQELERATDGIKAYDDGLASLVGDGKMGEAQSAFAQIAELIPEGMPQDEVMSQFGKYREALQGTANDLDVTGLSEKDYYEWMRGNVPQAIQQAIDAQDQQSGSFTGLSQAALAAQEQLEGVKQQLTEGASGFLDFATKATDAKVSLQQWIDDMGAQVEAQNGWLDNLSSLMERGAPQEFIDFLMQLGPEGAKRVKELADASDTDLQRAIDKFTEGRDAVKEFAENAVGLPPIDLDADASKLRGQVDDAKNRLSELEKMPTSPTVDAQITLLKEKIKEGESKLNELEKKPTTAKIDADAKAAKDEVGGFKKWFKDNSTVTMTVLTSIKDFFMQDNGRAKPGDSIVGPKGVPKKKATGGPISGPGTGTSDSIPTMLSNGEHVWTAYEVQRAGGHSAIESMRRAVVSGQRLAKGGAVGAAERRVDAANADLRAARRAKSDAKGQRRLADATRRLRQAEDEVDAAKRSLKAAKDRAKADEKSAKLAEQRARDERERQARVGSLQSDLRTDLRRGSIRDQVTGGLSGGYSAVDRLYGLGGNQDLSRGSRSRANSSARKFEANLRNLYGQAERIDAKLKAAQDKAQELKGIKSSVVNSLLGGRDLDVGTFSTNVGGKWVTGSNLGQAAKSLRVDVGAMKSFAGKLKKLVQLGVPGAIVQEIAQAGVVEGSNMADSFIDATAADRKSYLGAWVEYEQYANQAGQYVTEGFYKGGSAAADGVVKGLEGRKKSVESAIANLAKVMESTFKSVLGIRSPSRVMAELGGFTAEGLVQGMLGGVTDVQSAAAILGAAAVPSDMSFAVSATPVVADDEGQAGLAMQDMSTTTLDAMSQMQTAVSEGFAGMLANTQAAQAGMLADTQANQSGMLTATQTSNANMLVNTQTQQEAMRLAVATKQLEARTAATTEQEAMRLMLLDKQSQMKTQSATDFESMRLTTSTKLGDMRRGADTTMLGMHGDQSTRLDSMKATNKAGFESMLSTSNANMRAIRSGMDAEMSGAKPELGSNLNKLISVFASFTASVNKAFGEVGVKLNAPSPLKFETGGVMPGYTPGRDVHEFYSPTAGNLYLSGGEAIMRPEWTRAMGGEAGVKAQNDAARQGRLDDLLHMQTGGEAFASGGVYGPVPGVNAFADAGVWRGLWGIIKSKFPSATLNSAYRGGATTVSGNKSYHSRGMAVDLGGPLNKIFDFLYNNYRNSSEIIYSPAGGRQIKNGQPYTYSGAVRKIHWNHVHWANRSVPGGAGSDMTPGAFTGGDDFMPPSHPFLDRAGVSAGSNLEKSYQQAAQKLTAQIYAKHAKLLPSGIAGQLGKGIMSQISEGLVKKAADYGKSQTFVMPGGSGVERWRDTVIQALKRVGLPTSDDYVNAWLRQIKSESGGNPSIRQQVRDVNSGGNEAMGLVQVIPGTFAAFRDKSLPNDRTHPLANLVAGMNWAKYKASRRGWNMLDFIGKGHGYEDGTKNAKRGLAIVGESGPELVNFQGGEQVLSNPESMRFMAANRTYVPTQGGMQFDQAAFTRAVADAVTANGVSPESIAAAMNGVRFTLKAGQHEFDAAVVTAVGTGYDQSVSRRSKSSQKIGAI